MANVILGVTISLDGFAEDRNGSVGALYPDLGIYDATGVMQETIRNTGAVVMAWKEYAMAEDPDWFAGNYEFQVPIFVVTGEQPKKHPVETGALTFSFVTDGFENAVRQAKKAAGEKDVTIIGSAGTCRECLIRGIADELHLDIIPVFLKEGFRPFDDIGAASIKVERIKVVGLPAGRTHLRFRLVK
jgi:dihydrofolate reductase